jgi:hypothetical protein
MTSKAYISVICSLLLLCGCASKNAETHRTIVLQNQSSKEMRDTTMRIGSYDLSFGYMGTNYAKVVGNYPRRFPDMVRLLWTTRGVEHDQTVNVSDAVAGADRGVLLLTVHDNRVDAKFEPEKRR